MSLFLDQIKLAFAGYKNSISNSTIEVDLELDQLETISMYCKENLEFTHLSNITVFHLGGKFLLTYTLQNLRENFTANLNLECNENYTMISLKGIWDYSDYFEREIYDLYGLKFDSIKSSERLLFADYLVGFPFRSDFSKFSFDGVSKAPLNRECNNTPQFKLSGEEISFHYNMKDNKMSDFVCEIGYRHVGFEKDAIGRKLTELPIRLSYLNNITPNFWSEAICRLVESKHDILIPDRAKVIRMIVTELARIKDHLYSLIKIGYNLEYYDYISDLNQIYERTKDQLAKLSSKMNMVGINIIGGVSFDIPFGWSTGCLDYLNKLEKDLSLLYSDFSKSSYFFDKLNCAKISKDYAIKKGITGPVLRASGYNLDLRKSNPYYFYSDLNFEVPLGCNGKVYDRFLVLNEEIFQSIKILFQVIDNLPLGKLKVERDLVNEKVQESFVYTGQGVETSRGITYLNCSTQNNLVTKLKINASSQQALAVVSDLMNNEDEQRKDLIWNSLLINMSEVER